MHSNQETLWSSERTSPYEHVFQTIEMMAKEQVLSPQAAYEHYLAAIEENDLDPRVYFSMSITSGGFARDESLGFGEVIGNNSLYGTKIKHSLLNEYPELRVEDIILPSELGKVKGWGQGDFLLFWFHIIAGVSRDHSQQISAGMTDALQLPGLHDSSLPLDQRWDDYKAFTDTYVELVKDLVAEHGASFAPNNMASVVTILDGKKTLGGRAEELLARSLGIPPEEPVVSAESFNMEDFYPMTQRLLDLGSTALAITTLPYLPHYYEGAIMRYGSVEYELPKLGGFRQTGLHTVIHGRDQRHQVVA